MSRLAIGMLSALRRGWAPYLLGVLWAFPVAAQLPDPFAPHFGAVRTYEEGVTFEVGASVMLLTEFGSRWVPDQTVYSEYDQLDTTVGYNYAHFGVQRSWYNLGPGGHAVVAVTGALGTTSDWFTRWGQDGLHDFRRFPHVQRGVVDSNTLLTGAAVEGAYWWRFAFWGFDVDVHPHLGASWATHHREAGGGTALGLVYWKLRLQGWIWEGWLYGNPGVKPGQIATRLEDGYRRFGGSLAIDRTKLGAAVRYIPTLGIGVSHSSGIFIGEKETFLSVFFEVPVGAARSVRVEVVNDLLANKDRGPTGGLRLSYVLR